MADFRTNDPAPAICGCSKQIVSVNMARKPHRCSKCKGCDIKLYGDATRSADSAARVLQQEKEKPPSLFFSNHVNAARELSWYEGDHVCPACGQYRLSFEHPSILFD
jgi:hypothetical protein